MEIVSCANSVKALSEILQLIAVGSECVHHFIWIDVIVRTLEWVVVVAFQPVVKGDLCEMSKLILKLIDVVSVSAFFVCVVHSNLERIGQKLLTSNVTRLTFWAIIDNTELNVLVKPTDNTTDAVISKHVSPIIELLFVFPELHHLVQLVCASDTGLKPVPPSVDFVLDTHRRTVLVNADEPDMFLATHDAGTTHFGASVKLSSLTLHSL